MKEGGGGGGGGEGVTVTGSDWIGGCTQVFLFYTLVQKQMCAHQTHPNSHKDMGEKCLLPAIIHIIHCKSSYNYIVPFHNGMFLLECAMV